MLFKTDSGGAGWLLVCLGNPGDKYENTRHNVGFMVADEIAERQRKPIQKLKFKALTNLFTISGEKVLVMKPITYMNLSGEAVRQAADFYKIPPERILVVSDDTALAVGRLRIRLKGSAGGHNGSSHACGLGWGRSPTRTMTWPTGYWASSRVKTRRPLTPPSSGPPMRWSVFSARAWTGLWENSTAEVPFLHSRPITPKYRKFYCFFFHALI